MVFSKLMMEKKVKAPNISSELFYIIGSIYIQFQLVHAGQMPVHLQSPSLLLNNI